MSMFSMACSRVTSGLATRLLEGIEVDHDQVDRRDAVSLGLAAVLLVVAEEKKAAVDLGVQRLHPAVEHLGKAGQVRDVADFQPGAAQGGGGAAGGDERVAGGDQAPGEIDQAGFVRDGEKRAFGHGWRKGRRKKEKVRRR